MSINQQEYIELIKHLNLNINSSSEIIDSLITMTEVRDSYTIGHSKRVAQYAYSLAKEMGEDEEFLRYIYFAGLLHDIGKIGIPDVVLLKPAKLNDTEYELIKTHSTLSYKILYHIKGFENILPAIKHHHERYDGSGYPSNLKAHKIPKMARYLSIVDVWDALTTRRIYRKAMSLDKALEIMEKEKNFYDPKLYKVFIQNAKKYYHLLDRSKKIIYPKLEEYRNDFFFRDNLTSTFNREALLYFIKKGAEREYGIYLGGFNIRHFSLFNKKYGSNEGDKLLITLTRLLFSKIDVFNTFGEIVENKFYIFRAYADHFYILYFGMRFDYLNIKLNKIADEISKQLDIEFYYYKLISKKSSPEKILREVDFLL